MAMRDLIPWNNNRGREVSVRRSEETTPFLTLHREMNRLSTTSSEALASPLLDRIGPEGR